MVYSKDNRNLSEGTQLCYDDLVIQTLSENNQLLKAEIIRLKKQHETEIKALSEEYERKFAEFRKSRNAFTSEEILRLKEEVNQERRQRESEEEKYKLLQVDTLKLLQFKKESEEKAATFKAVIKASVISVVIIACFLFLCISVTKPKDDYRVTSEAVSSSPSSIVSKTKTTAKPKTTVKPTSAPKATATPISVWIPATGKRYHDSKSCAGKSPRLVTIDEAKRLGYTSCGRCKPPW